MELAGDLVPGDGLAAMGLDVLEAGMPVGPWLDDGRYLWPQRSSGAPTTMAS